MDIQIKPGTYIAAISGGVDSIVLLDLLRKVQNIRIIVAHFDHGIRSNSSDDRRFVAKLARSYGLPFEYSEGHLGPQASENYARSARYAFLEGVKTKMAADGIITAHHQDDVLETAIFNILRGTGRRGLTSLKSARGLLRPLLDVTKKEIVEYATNNDLAWHEDSTNTDIRYSRNYVRQKILGRATEQQRNDLLNIVLKLRQINPEIDRLLGLYLQKNEDKRLLNRQSFIMFPHVVAKEIMVAWLRMNGVMDYDKRTIERLVWAAKTFKPGKCIDINRAFYVTISTGSLALNDRDR